MNDNQEVASMYKSMLCTAAGCKTSERNLGLAIATNSNFNDCLHGFTKEEKKMQCNMQPKHARGDMREREPHKGHGHPPTRHTRRSCAGHRSKPHQPRAGHVLSQDIIFFKYENTKCLNSDKLNIPHSNMPK